MATTRLAPQACIRSQRACRSAASRIRPIRSRAAAYARYVGAIAFATSTFRCCSGAAAANDA